MDYKQVAEDLIKKHTLFLGTTDNGEEVWTDPLDAIAHCLITVEALICEYEMISEQNHIYLTINNQPIPIVEKYLDWLKVEIELRNMII